MEGIGDARRAKRAAGRVAAAASANGWTPSVIDLGELANQLERMTRLVLCGGDGLVHRAVQVLAGSDVEVAVVPAGTGNDLARAFGVGGSGAIILGFGLVALISLLPLPWKQIGRYLGL